MVTSGALAKASTGLPKGIGCMNSGWIRDSEVGLVEISLKVVAGNCLLGPEPHRFVGR